MPLFSQLHNRNGLGLILFRKRVFERGTRIAKRFAPDLLRAVEMAERDIVKAVKHGGVHIVGAADRNVLRVRADASGHKLMRHEHIACRRINVHMLHGAAERVSIALDRFLRVETADVHRLDERKKEKVYLAESIRERHRFDMSVINRREKYAARRHKIRAERNAFGRIVVAGYGKHRDVTLRERTEKSVEKLDCLSARHGAVVYIACDHNGVGTLFFRQRHYLFKNESLIVDQGKLIHAPSKMQIGQMKEFQAIPPIDSCNGFILPPKRSLFNLFPGFRRSR